MNVLTYTEAIDEPFYDVVMVIMALTDILTSLSILLLHHLMGLRMIKETKKDDVTDPFHDSLYLPATDEKPLNKLTTQIVSV